MKEIQARKEYQGLTLDTERALYQIEHADVVECAFEGLADGESALKECSDILVKDCRFLLRYPLWHTHGGHMTGCVMTDTCRAALWYDHDMTIEKSTLGGIKALRECDRMELSDCHINSSEFGWFCRDIRISDCHLQSEYPFMRCTRMEIDRLHMKAKYSFQYIENTVISNSVLDTKDAFWHSKRVTVRDSVISGEYLGWYAEDLTLINCRIIGTQPLCYCKNLVMKNCEMEGCDFSFENSTVEADIRGEIMSVRAPAGGQIVADAYGAVLYDYSPADGSQCRILVRDKA